MNDYILQYFYIIATTTMTMLARTSQVRNESKNNSLHQLSSCDKLQNNHYLHPVFVYKCICDFCHIGERFPPHLYHLNIYLFIFMNM